MTKEVDFSSISLLNPELHPVMEEIITETDDFVTNRFPNVSYELVPLGSGRGPGSKVRAILRGDPNSNGSMNDLDLGLITFDPWPNKLPHTYFAGEVARFCKNIAYNLSIPTCSSFNPNKMYMYVNTDSILQKLFLIKYEEDRYHVLTESMYKNLTTLALPLLSLNSATRGNYMNMLITAIKGENNLWSFAEENRLINELYSFLVPKLSKQFKLDSELQKKFEYQAKLF